MPLPKIAEARKLNDTELTEEILKVKKELFELRLLKATGRLEKSHEFKHKRHKLAQLLTLERERELAAEREGVSAQDALPQTEAVVQSTSAEDPEAVEE